MEQVTDDILRGLQNREVAKKGAKGKAKPAAKPKPKSSPKKSLGKVLPTIEKKGLPKTISKPKAGCPVKYGRCSIYHSADRWRVTTEGNRRYDKSFPFKRSSSWTELVEYCKLNA